MAYFNRSAAAEGFARLTSSDPSALEYQGVAVLVFDADGRQWVWNGSAYVLTTAEASETTDGLMTAEQAADLAEVVARTGDYVTVPRAQADNLAARNVITQSGGVPAGVFGSEGNTILEYNCFKAGIQAYNYNGNLFLGVTVRKNVINIGASFVPDTSVLAGWSTNVDGTNCALMPT